MAEAEADHEPAIGSLDMFESPVQFGPDLGVLFSIELRHEALWVETTGGVH